MRKLGLLLAVFSIVMIAGCVGGNPFQSLFGGPGEVREAPSDIIIAQNENVVPPSPVLAGDEFTVSFEVKNIDDINPVPDVGVGLYDWGLCDDSRLTAGGWTKTGSTYVQTLGKMGPGQSKPLDLTLIAPSAKLLGNLPGRCPVKYKVTYSFTASTSTSAEAISKTRWTDLQAAGQTPTFTPTTDIGRGPIKIYMAPVGALPARTGSTLYVSIQVQNKGTGTYLRVPKGGLSFRAPESWTLADACGGDFTETGSETNYTIYANTRVIDLVGADKKTYEMRCGFTMPDVQETKDYFLFASLPYTYDMIREIDVDVNPG